MTQSDGTVSFVVLDVAPGTWEIDIVYTHAPMACEGFASCFGDAFTGKSTIDSITVEG